MLDASEKNLFANVLSLWSVPPLTPLAMPWLPHKWDIRVRDDRLVIYEASGASHINFSSPSHTLGTFSKGKSQRCIECAFERASERLVSKRWLGDEAMMLLIFWRMS